jgi:hypothetical protein
MKKYILFILSAAIVCLTGCSPSVAKTTSTTSLKKIALEDSPYVLNLTQDLPVRFEQINAVDEGLSNADLGLGPDWSEVQVFLSQDPYQLIYCCLYISKSKLEQAQFDSQIKDETQMRTLIENAVKKGADEQGNEINMPNIEFSRPGIGDSILFGQGSLESYGIYYGFDTLWFRTKTVYVIIYSVSHSADKVSLVPVATEIEKRIAEFSH